MVKKVGIGAAILLIIGVGLFFWLRAPGSSISRDTTIHGNYAIETSKTVVLKAGAKLTVTGNMTIDGTLSCEGGTLPIVILGNLTVHGALVCILDENSHTKIPGVAMSIAAKHVEFGAGAEVGANGSVEIVSDQGAQLASADDIARVYKETQEDSSSGARIGPFVSEHPTQQLLSEEDALVPTPSSKKTESPAPFIMGGVWHLGDGEKLSSGVTVPTPLKNSGNLLVYLNAGTNDVQFAHLLLSGSSGDDAENISGCSATGKRGGDALHVRMIADVLTIDNATLKLGNGGKGGSADTPSDCPAAKAIGGEGGSAGNFKFTATSISINKFHIIPGRGGKGGDANATGADGVPACPGSPGGSAGATGGRGSDNYSELSVVGNVVGLKQIEIGRTDGGSGGFAKAQPGRGGDGSSCGCAGGVGGDGVADSGKGGNASVHAPLITGEAHGGDGGRAEVVGGGGGTGGSCAHNPTGTPEKGGNGGAGGRANATPANGGTGTTAAGNAGELKIRAGGIGGNGGDACIAGIGGEGGIGFPLGHNGADGKTLCASATVAPKNAPSGPVMIKAILYHGKYLPVDQLRIESAGSCGSEHWRADGEDVTATDGSTVTNSLLPCGYGKTREITPVLTPEETTKIR